MSDSFAPGILPIAAELFAAEVARTNPKVTRRATRNRSGTVREFDPDVYAATALQLFWLRDIDGQEIELPELCNVVGRFLFSDFLSASYPNGYKLYELVVTRMVENPKASVVDQEHESEDEGVRMDYGQEVGFYPTCDSGYHSPTLDRKSNRLADPRASSKMGADDGDDCYRNSPVISIDTQGLVALVHSRLAFKLPTDRNGQLLLWEQIICMNRPAINGRSIIEQKYLNGQLDVASDQDCIQIKPLTDFRSRVFEMPQLLLRAQQMSDSDSTREWISYEWLTMAHFVLEAMEKVRVARS